jgi:N utilization substance protein B
LKFTKNRGHFSTGRDLNDDQAICFRRCDRYDGDMYRRTRAREVALQLLFQRDLNPGVERPAVERFVNERLRDALSSAYCLRLFDGVTASCQELDQKLSLAADNWSVARMAGTDRNVLRLAAFELQLADPETPAAVVINEAVELARRFGSVNSPAFVNGVLDRFHKNLAEPAPAS